LYGHLDWGRNQISWGNLKACVPVGLRDCLYQRRLLFSFPQLLKLHSWGYGEPRNPRKSNKGMALTAQPQKATEKCAHLSVSCEFFPCNMFWWMQENWWQQGAIIYFCLFWFVLFLPIAYRWRENKILCCLNILCYNFWPGLLPYFWSNLQFYFWTLSLISSRMDSACYRIIFNS
jgi:hypothetical protein